MKRTLDFISNNIKCTGCGACVQACPSECIMMKEDTEGFLYPVVNDIDKCANCGKCEEACPIGRVKKLNTEQLCYGFTENEKKRIINSSSGGAFHALAVSIIEAGGYVFGSVYNDKLEVVTKGINRLDDLVDMCGSKYVISNTQSAFKEIKKLLIKGELVMYCSTPCQIAGLQCFLKKEYSNLLLIDLFCAGSPSQLLFTEYIRWMEDKYKQPIVNYEFRDRNVGWEKLARKITLKNGQMNTQTELTKDPYYSSFLARKTLREACYQCAYTNTSRWGDISIGDFWGVQKLYDVTEEDMKRGISAVIVNTEKGRKFFDKLKSDNTVFDTTIENIRMYNYAIEHPAERHPYRDNIYKSLGANGFEKTAKEFLYTSRGIRRIVSSLIPEKLKIKIALLLKLKN